MDTSFDDLDRLTFAAESCNALVRGFVSDFGEDPEFSDDDFAMEQQARQHLDTARWHVSKLREAIRLWNESANALPCVGAALGISLPVVMIDGQTFQTAHEAARYLAQAAINRFYRVEGIDVYERSLSLSIQLSDLATAPDLHGRIHAENCEVAKGFELVAPDKSNPANVDSEKEKGSKALETLLGEEVGEIMKIANSAETVDNKQRAICAIDLRFVGYTGGDWANLLGVSEAACRNTNWWKVDKVRLRNRDE